MFFNVEETYEFAKVIIKKAGELLLELKQRPLQMKEKKSHSDLVTFVDKEIEKFLVNEINIKFPEHGIIGEEGVSKKNIDNCETVWIIDPIDGTTNFIHGFPFYAITIGIIHKGVGVIGVVMNPSTGELFHACSGYGAYVNEKKLELNPPNNQNDDKIKIDLKDSLVSTTFYWEDVNSKDKIHPVVIELYKETRGVRMIGGAAIGLCEVAKGTLTAYFMPRLKPWDYAGGTIILKEAGGRVTRINGEEINFLHDGNILGTHPDIYKEMKNKFKGDL